MQQIARLDETAIRKAYARWAPVYDYSFGLIAEAGRKRAVAHINSCEGNVLEVGIGTGITLPRYAPHLKITGIDLSPEMLDKARERVVDKSLRNVEGLYEMDASALAFENEAFDIVVAMYVMTVVPDPRRVMGELERVTRPGGEVLIVNHFAQNHGLRGRIEHWLAPASRALGWHPDFRVEAIMRATKLTLLQSVPLGPLGLFTMLRFSKPV